MRWFVVGVLSVTVACGPAVPADGDGTTSSGNDDAGDTSTPTPTTAPMPADESTTGADTSASTSTSAEATMTADDSGGSGFPDPTSSDDVNIRCDLWAQDCMDGQKCMPSEDRRSMVWGRTDCFDLAAEPGAPGDPCFVEGDQWSGADDCELASMCWNTDPETNAGTCAGFCMGSEANPVCLDGESCFIAYDGHIILCLPTCEPLAPACPEGLACVQSYIGDEPYTSACIPESLVVDRTAYADACDDNVGCGSGLVCVDAEHVPLCDTEKCCSLLCDPLAGNGCPELARGQFCVPFEEQPELGHCGF